MTPQLTDEQVDAIQCTPVAAREPGAWLCRVEGTDDDVLRPFLTSQWWPHLEYYAEALAIPSGGDYDEWGFDYDTDGPYPDYRPLTGVQVRVPWDERVVGTEAFERLMARWYAAILEAVSLQALEVVDEPWWPQLLANVAALTERVDARGAPPA